MTHPSRKKNEEQYEERRNEEQLEDQTGTRWTGAGRFFERRELSFEETLRETTRRWIIDMHLPEFGTLTLAAKHSPDCWDQGSGKRSCVAGTTCYVPGVQSTENSVSAWLEYVSGAVVVEEFGSSYNTGRRHFHYLSTPSDAYKRGKRWCFRCLAKRKHIGDCDLGGSAFKGWESYVGHVDRAATAQHPDRAAEYVVKTVNYVLKEYQNDYAGHANAKHDAAERRTVAGRVWIKRESTV